MNSPIPCAHAHASTLPACPACYAAAWRRVRDPRLAPGAVLIACLMLAVTAHGQDAAEAAPVAEAVPPAADAAPAAVAPVAEIVPPAAAAAPAAEPKTTAELEAIRRHPREIAVLRAMPAPERHACFAAAAARATTKPTAAERAEHAWARAHWAAVSYMEQHCRQLSDVERFGERVRGARPNQFAMECDPMTKRPAGATAEVLEHWTLTIGEDVGESWAAFEASTWPALAAPSKECVAVVRAVDVLDADIKAQSAKR